MDDHDPIASKQVSTEPDLRFPFPIQKVQDRKTRPSSEAASTTKNSVRTSRLPMRRSKGPEVEWDRYQPEPLRGAGDSTKYNHPFKNHCKAGPTSQERGHRTLTASIATPASTSAWAERRADETDDDSSDGEPDGNGEEGGSEGDSYDGEDDPLVGIVRALEAEAEEAERDDEEGAEGDSVTPDTEAVASGAVSGRAAASGAGNATQSVAVKGDRLPTGKQHIEGSG